MEVYVRIVTYVDIQIVALENKNKYKVENKTLT